MLTHFFLPHIGGVERHLYELSRTLKRKGYEISILTEKHSSSLKDEDLIDGLRVLRFDYPKKKFIGLFLIWMILLKHRNHIKEADIIHIHDVFIWYFPFRLLYPKKPVYITFHGYETYPIKNKAILLRKLAEILCRGNICIGSFIEKWYGTIPTITTYGGVDLKKFYPSSQRPIYDSIFVSRLDEQTGILTYLTALEFIRKINKKFSLLILGDGKYRKKADKVAITRGFISNPSNYLRQSRFAFVNRYLAILEAFASKKLVFAVFDNPVKRDYLLMAPFNEWLIIESDPEKLATKVLFYINNPNKATNKIELAYEWVQGQTWEKMAENYMTLWGSK